MTKYFLLLALLCGATCAGAQKIFTKGFIITLAGDTLRGEILDEPNEALSKQVLFRKNSTEAAATFLPKDIRGFGLGDRETFTSFTVPFRMGLNESANTKKMVETRFLRLIEPGTIQLFKLYVSDINYALYVRKNDLPLEPLTLVINTIAGAEGNQQQKILNSDTVTLSKSLIQGDYVFRRFYYGTLQSLFLDCPAAKMKGVPELEDDLITTVVRKYNRSCGKSFTPKQPIGKRFVITALANGGASAYSNAKRSTNLVSSVNAGGDIRYFGIGININNRLKSKRASEELIFNYGTQLNNAKGIRVPAKRYQELVFRHNILFTPERRLSPHISAGMGVTHAYTNTFNVYEKDYFIRLSLAAGVHYFFKNRSFIRIETVFPDAPGVRLSYAYRFIK
jgi:hypothetical protein